jgi:predicted transcriptional regulator
MPKKGAIIKIRVDEDLKIKLTKLAYFDKKSASDYVRRLIESEVKKAERKKKI